MYKEKPGATKGRWHGKWGWGGSRKIALGRGEKGEREREGTTGDGDREEKGKE